MALMRASNKELLKAKRLNEVYRPIVGALTAKEVVDSLGHPERLVTADLVRFRGKGLLKRVKADGDR